MLTPTRSSSYGIICVDAKSTDSHACVPLCTDDLDVDLVSLSGLQGDVYGSGGRGTVTAVQGLLRSQHQRTPGKLFKIQIC